MMIKVKWIWYIDTTKDPLFSSLGKLTWCVVGHGWCHVTSVCVYELRDYQTTEPYNHAVNTRGNCHIVLRQPEEANSRHGSIMKSIEQMYP